MVSGFPQRRSNEPASIGVRSDLGGRVGRHRRAHRLRATRTGPRSSCTTSTRARRSATTSGCPPDNDAFYDAVHARDARIDAGAAPAEPARAGRSDPARAVRPRRAAGHASHPRRRADRCAATTASRCCDVTLTVHGDDPRTRRHPAPAGRRLAHQQIEYGHGRYAGRPLSRASPGRIGLHHL